MRSVEDLIPSSKHLKDIGISFDQALVWVDCIKEVAQKERIDERTAAWKLADMLRSFKGLCGLENAIQQANQQLAMLLTVDRISIFPIFYSVLDRIPLALIG